MNRELGWTFLGFAFGLLVAALLFIGWRDLDARQRCEATSCAVGKPMLVEGLRCVCAVDTAASGR